MKKENKDFVSYRKAHYLFNIDETFEAGIVLLGTEVKSLRDHGGSLSDNYILIKDLTPILKNAHIAPYKHGNTNNHPEKRDRILLLHKRETKRLKAKIRLKGFTLVALSIYPKRGRMKVKIALCKGKTTHDKRHNLKEKEAKKEIKQHF